MHLPDYDDAIARLIADIDAATRHVHLLYYIFADDPIGNRVGDALVRASGRGGACRVLSWPTTLLLSPCRAARASVAGSASRLALHRDPGNASPALEIRNPSRFAPGAATTAC